jgi:hypothetical protein
MEMRKMDSTLTVESISSFFSKFLYIENDYERKANTASPLPDIAFPG